MAGNKQDILVLKRDDSEEFIELMRVCFGEGLERDRFNFVEVAKLMRKINKPLYRLVMKFMKVKMINYGIKRDGKLVSALTLSIEKKSGNIGNVMTHPDYRRQGLARKLFREAVSTGKAMGLDKITLDVHAQNAGAIKLYENEGFKKYYHAGRLVFDLSHKEMPITNDDVVLKGIKKIDPNLYDSFLDDCYTQELLKDRNRKKMAKNHIPPSFIRFILEKAAGQKLYFYEIYVENDEHPKGYLDASTSRIQEGVRISSPLVKNEDIDLVVPAITKIYSKVDDNCKCLNLKLSMHRKDLIKKLLNAGFELKEESLYMRIQFEENEHTKGEN
ncbi:MAG: GNAT family N-acetyltransferase [Asgard group archaeon]|nr:GNAT family N-acetyltransferase [Asgard group archaeon]